MRKRELEEKVEALMRLVGDHVTEDLDRAHRLHRTIWPSPSTITDACNRVGELERKLKNVTVSKHRFQTHADAEIATLQARVKELSLAVCRLHNRKEEA